MKLFSVFLPIFPMNFHAHIRTEVRTNSDPNFAESLICDKGRLGSVTFQNLS